MKLIIMYRTAEYAEEKHKSIKGFNGIKQVCSNIIVSFNRGKHHGTFDDKNNLYSKQIF